MTIKMQNTSPTNKLQAKTTIY